MNQSKTLRGIALALVLLLCLLCPLSVSAAEDTATLTLVDQYNGTAIPGAAFRLYKVAEFSGSFQFTANQDFAGAKVSLSVKEGASSWADQASTLEAYTVQQTAAGAAITPVATGTTDSSGTIVFPALPKGLYLLVGDQITVDSTIYKPAAILLTLPYPGSNGSWDYTPTLNAKNSATPVPSTPSNPGSSSKSYTVTKVWKDDDGTQARPQSVTVTLYRGDKACGTATLSADNNWRYTWRGLSASGTYYVTEQDIPEGYTVTSVQNGTTFVVTNTYTPAETPPDDTPDDPTPSDDIPDNPVPNDNTDTPEEPTPSTPEEPTPSTPTVTTTVTKTTTTTTEKLPQTGQLWWPVTALSVGGLLMVLVGWGFRKKDSGYGE